MTAQNSLILDDKSLQAKKWILFFTIIDSIGNFQLVWFFFNLIMTIKTKMGGKLKKKKKKQFSASKEFRFQVSFFFYLLKTWSFFFLLTENFSSSELSTPKKRWRLVQKNPNQTINGNCIKIKLIEKHRIFFYSKKLS